MAIYLQKVFIGDKLVEVESFANKVLASSKRNELRRKYYKSRKKLGLGISFVIEPVEFRVQKQQAVDNLNHLLTLSKDIQSI